MTIPSHLPDRLTISLWDFSWFTQAMPEEPFESLDRAFAQAVERGYNTIRICAMPCTLFGGNGFGDTLRLANLGDSFGQGTRWYNCKGDFVFDGKQRLLELFRAAKRHDCFIIVSSWEYQQTPSFFATSEQHEALQQIPPERRCAALAEALAALVDFVKEHELDDRIAYVEMHNEVDIAATRLAGVAGDGQSVIAAQRPYVESALDALRNRHPDVLMTTCYARPPLHLLDDLAHNLQVAHFHLYVYGVLGRLCEETALWGETGRFPTEVAKRLLRPEAPPFDEWRPDEKWRLEATGVPRRLFYMHDWVDPEQWDLFLYEHYHLYRESMREAIRNRLEAYADYARHHDIPAVIGEGYVGYTPLYATFEDGPVGKDICEFAIQECLRLGYWGIILCSNAAPHHPFWRDIDWQKRLNAQVKETPPDHTERASSK